MHHVGCMAALNPTWFRAHSAIDRSFSFCIIWAFLNIIRYAFDERSDEFEGPTDHFGNFFRTHPDWFFCILSLYHTPRKRAERRAPDNRWE